MKTEPVLYLAPARTATFLLSFCLAACAGLGGPGASAPRVDAATPLQKLNLIALPVLLRSSVPPRDTALMNPDALPPALPEDSAARRHCSALSLDYTGEDLAMTAAERGQIERAYALGPAHETQRRVWRFELERAQAQDRMLNGPRQGRDGQPAAAVQPRPSAQPRAGSAGTPAPTRASIGAALGAALGRGAAAPTPATPRADTLAQGSPALAEARRALAHNLAVLKAQDTVLAAAEDAYADTLLQAQTAMLVRWQAAAPQDIKPARLAAYDHFLERQVRFCIAQRGRLHAANAGRLQAASDALTRLAQQAFAANRPAYVQMLAAAGSSMDLDILLRESFGTPIVRRVAFEDTAFAATVQQTRLSLEQREAQARQAERERVAAEARRAALALRQQYQDYARRNQAPTEAQVAELALARSMALTDAHTSYRVVRTGPLSYETRQNLFGNVLITHELRLQISKLSCKPAKARQHCSFDATLRWTSYGFAGVPKVEPVSTETSSADFYWTEEGLKHDDKLEMTYLATRTTSGGGGDGGSASAPGGQRSLEDAFADRERANRQRFDDRNLGMRHQYDPSKPY